MLMSLNRRSYAFLLTEPVFNYSKEGEHFRCLMGSLHGSNLTVKVVAAVLVFPVAPAGRIEVCAATLC
jgi:hypothetical protein